MPSTNFAFFRFAYKLFCFGAGHQWISRWDRCSVTLLACLHVISRVDDVSVMTFKTKKETPLWQFVCHFVLRVQKPCDKPQNYQRARRCHDASSCWRAFEFICDGGGGAGGGCPLQVWTYLASGYSDDKIWGAGDLTLVFRQHGETCLHTVCVWRTV